MSVNDLYALDGRIVNVGFIHGHKPVQKFLWSDFKKFQPVS